MGSFGRRTSSVGVVRGAGAATVGGLGRVQVVDVEVADQAGQVLGVDLDALGGRLGDGATASSVSSETPWSVTPSSRRRPSTSTTATPLCRPRLCRPTTDTVVTFARGLTTAGPPGQPPQQAQHDRQREHHAQAEDECRGVHQAVALSETISVIRMP